MRPLRATAAEEIGPELEGLAQLLARRLQTQSWFTKLRDALMDRLVYTTPLSFSHLIDASPYLRVDIIGLNHFAPPVMQNTPGVFTAELVLVGRVQIDRYRAAPVAGTAAPAFLLHCVSREQYVPSATLWHSPDRLDVYGHEALSYRALLLRVHTLINGEAHTWRYEPQPNAAPPNPVDLYCRRRPLRID